jgi:outer membrane protein OmpA-like peptidoglycan-associated protein
MKNIYIILFCLFLSNVSFSQNKHDIQLNKERQEKIADAQYLFLNEEYAKALVAYRDLANSEPENANFNYLTGYCYLKVPFENGRSIPYLTKAIKNLSLLYKEGSNKEIAAPIDALFWLGYAYHLNKGYSYAQIYYKRYRDTLSVDDAPNIKMVDRQIESCNNARELSKHPVQVEIENLGNTINSSKGDLNPCVNGKGTSLLYTRIKEKNKKDTNNLSIYSKKEYQIFESTADKKGRWAKSVDISNQLGYEGQLKTLSLSSDGNELLLFKNDLEDGGPLSYKNGSIFYSKKVENKWSPAKLLNNNINSLSWESHAAISPNGKEIYFTSDRPGGFGGLDIYVSTLTNGDWGPAKNLGSTINTPFDEETPAILPDGKTLYFSSEGHNNMGGFDVFYSSKVDSIHWCEPINLGYPINSTDDNLFYVPIDDGSRAFYSVARNEGYITFGDEDIYELDINLDSLHLPEVKLHGTITLRDLKKVDTSFTITCKTTNPKRKIETKLVKPDIQTGNYEISLRPEDYEISFTADRYNTEIKKLSFTKIKTLTPIALDVTLDPIYYDENNFITFNKVYFNFDNATLTNEASNALNKLLPVMDNNQGLTLEITGHTDSRGTDKHSKTLALDRAKSVIDYLISKGIDSKRLIAKGEGTIIKSGEDMNRCAEIKILKSDNNSVVLTDLNTLKFLKKVNRYSVEIMESEKPVPMSQFNVLKSDFQYILGMSTPTGYLYYLGNFKDQAEAAVALNSVKAKGFKNAKTIDYFYINSLNTIDVISKTITNKKYTIQLLESDKKIALNTKDSQFSKEIKSKDGRYRYYFKEYSDISDAESELSKQIDQGYSNAFILDKRDLK